MKVSPAKATVDRPVPKILNVSPLTKLPVPVSPAVFIVVATPAGTNIPAAETVAWLPTAGSINTPKGEPTVPAP